MADFCQECGIRVYGEDTRDLAGLVTEAEFTEQGLVGTAICEGCGEVIFVDHNGRRLTREDIDRAMNQYDRSHSGKCDDI